MQIAIFGLGRMGGQIARRLCAGGFSVLAWNRSEGPRREFDKFVEGLRIRAEGLNAESRSLADVESLINQMNDQPRIFWLMLPHEIVEEFITARLGPHLQSGDILIDGGNSFYQDSVRRAQGLRKKGVVFYDCGVSGGIWGETNGFALMVGGPKERWQAVEPIFRCLSSGDNYGLVGRNGAGHFVKMVHNGIEYGMMEAIAEGYGVLQASPFDLNLKQVTEIYQKGTVIRSWLIDLMREILEQENIDAVKGTIASSGEGEWTVRVAKSLGVDVRVIEAALKVRQESSEPKNQQKFSNKLVALLRKHFGGHKVQNQKEL